MLKSIPSLVIALLLLAACNSKPEQVTSAPHTSAHSSTHNVSRSPQGIDNDFEMRRQQALEQRQQLKTQKFGDKEVRSYDGSGNNEEHYEWGASFHLLERLAAPAYEDGLMSLAGASRPSARAISNALFHQEEAMPNSYQTSDMLWQWGQFVDHDMGLTDGSTPEAAFIPVPQGDPYFDPRATGTAVIPFHRSIYDDSYADEQPRQQFNELNSWLDGSMIYGLNSERVGILRGGAWSPYLEMSEHKLLSYNDNDMPNANGFVRDPSSLFLSGDVRANEQVGLAVMHTLFSREHNRLVDLLKERYPRYREDGKHDELFEHARSLVIAEIQMITYNEFLPALLGEHTMPAYAGYKADVNPNLYNEFSVAAYRIGHSAISERLMRFDAAGNEIAAGSLSLRDSFFTAPHYLKKADDLDPFLRGLAFHKHQAIDIKVVESLRNFLFGAPGAGGFDLVALNIQRGRDHGVASYNDTRAAMGLARASTFADITTDLELQQALAATYTTVDNIDLWVGGLAETPLKAQGSQLGELFTAIVVKQFDDIRAADRFWYTRYLSDEDKALIADVTLAKIIRYNTNIGAELQDNVFIVPTP